MTPALACALVAVVATLAAVWPRVRDRAEPLSTGTTFIACALWTIVGGLASSSALVAVGAIGLIVTTLALSARALLGAPLRSRVPASTSRA